MHSALQISRKIDYALRAAIKLAELPEGKVMSFREIARIEQIPEEFLAKILRTMVSSGLIRSVRGPKGGYLLARPSQDITFLDVIEAAEGPVVINMCLQDENVCPIQTGCSMVNVWAKAQNAMLDVLKGTSLEDVLRTGSKSKGEALQLDPTNESSPISLGQTAMGSCSSCG